MDLKKVVVMAGLAGAIFSSSQVAHAGLFDDLNKMQKDLEKLQSGSIPKAPSAGGNATGSAGMLGMGSSASGGGMSVDAAAKDKVDSVCRASWREGQVNAASMFRKLPKPNIQLLKTDFSIAPDKINTELNQAPNAAERNADVASLQLYKNAFESGEIASLFSQFLDTVGNKADYMSIMKQAADAKSGFDTKKKAIKRDAQQAYGIMLLYYQSRGANASTGMSYLKAAGKGDPTKAFIATYQLGHRAYFGIGEAQNLTKAATWMLKSYEAVERRKNADLRVQTAIPLSQGFIQLVTNEFMGLVAHPAYKRRAMYAELAQAAQSMQNDLAQSMQNAKGRSPSIVAITEAYLARETEINAKILRAIGQEAQATIEEQRVQKFVDDQSKDAEKYNDYSYKSSETRQFLVSALQNVKSLDSTQKQKFSDAMGDLALLTIEMNRITQHMVSQFALGKVDVMQMTVAMPVFTSVKVTCNLYDALNNVGTKMGAPKADVEFSSDADDTVINMAIVK
jgi:hypothetical protein